MNGFTINQNTNGTFYSENYGESQRGKCISLKDKYGMRVAKSTLNDSVSIHDENFAFLSTTLAKLHAKVYEPKAYFTYKEDIDINVGGGFVDYVEYYTVDWAGIVAEFRNLVSNNANFIPRVNAGLSQKTAKVFTYEVAYDLRFIELEKAKKLTLAKSIEEIYRNAILVGWDMFVQKIAYTGLNGANGLFNSANVKVQTIDNNGTTGQGFEGLTDDAVEEAKKKEEDERSEIDDYREKEKGEEMEADSKEENPEKELDERDSKITELEKKSYRKSFKIKRSCVILKSQVV